MPNRRPSDRSPARDAARSKANSISKVRTLAALKKKTVSTARSGDKAVQTSEQKEALLPTRQIPWWFVPEHHRAHTPGGLLGGGGKPPRPPGPGPKPGPGPGPGPFPPGPGPFPPGPGPFPPGPGPFPPGPGPFPPGPGPFPPGPGPFPPGPGPFPPGPFPVPIPIPIPIGPIPGPFPGPFPGPVPGPGNFVAVTVDGGLTFPGISGTSYVSYFPGMTLRQALLASGRVRFGPDGFIIWVAGITITNNVAVTLRYNGRVIPQTALDLPITPGGTINLSLYYL